MNVGAPIGNTNSNKSNRLWADTIRRAALANDGKALREMAEALFLKASEGDIAAIKEIGDRLDGKPAQVLAGDSENPLVLFGSINWNVAKP